MIDPRDRDICAHHSEIPEEYFRSVVPPICENSLFVFKKLDDINEAFNDEYAHHIYTRGKNPTVEILEAKLAALERAEACKCFSSGIAAITATFGVICPSCIRRHNNKFSLRGC